MTQFFFKCVGLVIITGLLWPSSSKASSELICEFDKYSNASGAKIDVIKSFIPQTQQHQLIDRDTVVHTVFGIEGEITKDNDKRVEFRYEFVNRGTVNVLIRYIFFRTTSKINVTMKPQGYQDIGPVWGKCQEIKNTTNQYTQYSDASDLQVCNEAYLASITNVSEGWIHEAEKRWGKNYLEKCANIREGSSEPSTTPTTATTSKLDKAKSTCAEIGFTAGTEDYGKCVLKMMDN